MADEKFKFYFPAEILKSSDENGQEVMMFKGIASTSDKDSQNESLDPSTFDLRESLWINWNHAASKDPGAVIGETTKKEITANNELYIEGVLYPQVENAKKAYTLMKALQFSPSGNKLGISVEGKVVQRASEDKKSPLYNKILKARISGAALCPVPINGRTWADILKGEVDSDSEEEFDEDTQKAMTAADGDNVTSKESVEGAPKSILKKSEIYERIHNNFSQIDIEKAKSVYSLIEKTSTMENQENKVEITDETITKAFEILKLAKNDDIIKAEKADADKKAKESEEDDDEKEMVKKASEKSQLLKSEGKTEDEIKSTLIKKGFGESVISKALKSADGIEKAQPASITKEEISDLFKAEMGSYNEKFAAVATILEKTVQQNSELKKSLEAVSMENGDLKEKIEKFGNTSNAPKSFLTKSYTEKGLEKSEAGKDVKPKFNLNSPKDRKILKAAILDKSGINKSEKFDKTLVDIAQDLELMHNITKSEDAQVLSNHGFEVVYE